MPTTKEILAALILLAAACAATEETPQITNPHGPGAGSQRDSAAGPQELRFVSQPGWVEETPSSSMRKAQYRLPGGGLGTEDASLVVYYFGATAGSVERNMERWIDQFENPDGGAVPSERGTREAGGFTLHEIAVAGTYVAETQPGSGEHLNQPGYRMLAAIAEASGGTYYIKLIGPRACVGHWETSYQEFMRVLFP